jgi:transposase-like protein
MAERRTRRRFTAEFKAQAVKRLLDGGKGLSEVATELGLSTGVVEEARQVGVALATVAAEIEQIAAREAVAGRQGPAAPPPVLHRQRAAQLAFAPPPCLGLPGRAGIVRPQQAP